MLSRKLLACTLLACCLAAAQAKSKCGVFCDAPDCACQYPDRRKLLSEGRKLLASDGQTWWRKGVVSLQRVVGCEDEDEGTPCLTIDDVRDAVHDKVINVTILSMASERDDPRLEAWEGQALTFFFNADNSSVADGTIQPAAVHAAVSHLDFCPVAGGNVLNITARLDSETTFDGAPVRGDLIPGTIVEVLVGQWTEMEQRGHEWHLVAHLGDSKAGQEATC